MKIKLYAQWRESGFGYIIGGVWVEDGEGRLLMDEEDMYFNIEYILNTFFGE